MEEGEEGVISVESSDDEIEDNTEDLTAMLDAERSREECIIDPVFEKNAFQTTDAKHQLYDQAVNRVSLDNLPIRGGSDLLCLVLNIKATHERVGNNGNIEAIEKIKFIFQEEKDKEKKENPKILLKKKKKKK
ncbi:hypothetical protein PsorP6_010662 [Peronosclerospora sorghi]|uniref:Uncharacterized protein n=1 Tax=Peronosclerospora sorghi TaxID=230839 RepID=A0ACC0VVI9_9STRA|nr:hypothetical protein PsorP6_010662 [Peronosclerospora sorghi]